MLINCDYSKEEIASGTKLIFHFIGDTICNKNRDSPLLARSIICVKDTVFELFWDIEYCFEPSEKGDLFNIPLLGETGGRVGRFKGLRQSVKLDARLRSSVINGKGRTFQKPVFFIERMRRRAPTSQKEHSSKTIGITNSVH